MSFIENNSSYIRLVKTVSFFLRFLRGIHPQEVVTSAEERNSALKTTTHKVQRHYYSNECDLLNLNVKKRSCLLSLTPFLYCNGIIRIGGHLHNSNLPFNQKHLIVLPTTSELLELYVRYLHENYFHATKASIVNFANLHYWIVGNLKRMLKKVIFQCVICRRYSAAVGHKIMGQLSFERVSEADAFNYRNVDFADPFDRKCTILRKPRKFT